MNFDKALMAEQALIGCILQSNDAWEETVGEITEEDFMSLFERRIFSTIFDMKKTDINKIIDIITVSDHIKLINDETKQEVFTRLFDIFNNYFAVKNIRAYVEIIKRESEKRKTIDLIKMTHQKISNDDEDYLDFIRQELSKIENNSSFYIKKYNTVINEVINKLDDDCNNGGVLSGLSTGFEELDDYTNGLQNGDLIVLGARPSMGKTMLMLNIAENISYLKQNEPVVLFSLEMPAAQIAKRSLSRASRVKGELIFKAKLSLPEWNKISSAVTRLESSKLFINDSSRMSVYQMKSFCRKIRNEHGLRAIFVDYLGLMDGEGENETLRISKLSMELKALAKDFNVPVFVLCQLSRRIEERKDRRPILSDLRQSGSIEQDADLVMFLDRDKDLGNEALLIIAKHRNGKIGDINLSLDLDYFEFKDFMGHKKR